MHWVNKSILVGLLGVSLQLSSEQLHAQGRATFTGSNDAEPLMAGFGRDVLTQDANGFTLSNGPAGYVSFDEHSIGGTYPELDSAASILSQSVQAGALAKVQWPTNGKFNRPES